MRTGDFDSSWTSSASVPAALWLAHVLSKGAELSSRYCMVGWSACHGDRGCLLLGCTSDALFIARGAVISPWQPSRSRLAMTKHLCQRWKPGLQHVSYLGRSHCWCFGKYLSSSEQTNKLFPFVTPYPPHPSTRHLGLTRPGWQQKAASTYWLTISAVASFSANLHARTSTEYHART